MTPQAVLAALRSEGVTVIVAPDGGLRLRANKATKVVSPKATQLARENRAALERWFLSPPPPSAPERRFPWCPWCDADELVDEPAGLRCRSCRELAWRWRSDRPEGGWTREDWFRAQGGFER